MPEIEQYIADWRKELANSEAILPENIDELEDHLRVCLTDLMALGLSTDEAFFVSTRRLGTSSALSREFRKVNGDSIWVQRLLWIMSGALLVQAYGIWTLFAEFIGRLVISSSALGSTILYSAIAICFPIGLWLAMTNIFQNDKRIQGRLGLYLQSVVKKPKTVLSLLAAVFTLLPLLRFIMHVITWRVGQIERLGEYYSGLFLINFAAEFLPVVLILGLAWLTRQRQAAVKI